MKCSKWKVPHLPGRFFWEVPQTPNTLKIHTCLATLICAIYPAYAENSTGSDSQGFLAEIHEASIQLREKSLRATIAKDNFWISGVWGDNLWSLSALYLNERVDEANARLLRPSTAYIEAYRLSGCSPAPTPERPDGAPWTFFSLTDYVRILHLFHSGSRHFPARLTQETEAAMKEALWIWVSQHSKIVATGPDDLFHLLGTENHDLNLRPNQYLTIALLADNPAYKDRRLADGHTLAEHLTAHTAFFREWPVSRAKSGLWVELGSNTYQKYSWPALFNLHDLAPDPVVRHRFGMLLALAFIEEEQIAVNGRRGGGRSRAATGAANRFESYKNLLFASPGKAAGSSHSRVIETSRYQLPVEAIMLRHRTFPAAEPFVIRNRVLGTLAPDGIEENHRLTPDSALVNYAYRSTHYLLGSTLQNPALAMPHPETGEITLKYTGISRQNRSAGILFDDPSVDRIQSIHTVIEKTRGGRPQHPFWSVQHKNTLIIQRIPPMNRSTLGSYSTGRVGMSFSGKNLEKTETNGWIFATNGKAFAAVRFLDGGHVWDDNREVANPANFHHATDTSRILIHTGDITSHGSFGKFREKTLTLPLAVSAEKTSFQHIEMPLYQPSSHDSFTLPLVHGVPVDLHPPASYQSPYLNGEFGKPKITLNVGPARILDFSGTGE